MKKKLLEALTTKFAGVDAKILDRVAENLLKNKTVETDDDVTTAVEGVTFADVLQSYGDARANDASKTAVSNYEKKYNLKDGKAQTADDTDPDKKDDGKGGSQKGDMPEWAKDLVDQLKAAKDEIASMKKGKVTDSRKQRLTKAIEELTDLQKKPYSRISLDSMSDDDFEAFMTEVEKEVKDFVKENKARGGAFAAPGAGPHEPSGEEATEAELAEIIGNLS